MSWTERGPRRFPKAIYACRADPRFSWCMHVPASFAEAPGEHRLVIAVHGSSRNVQGLRDGFASHAEAHRWVVLAPLFPVGVLGDGNPDGYKALVEGDIRYDEVLLGMVAELEQVLETRFPQFGLFGFSGGGQFAHRFLYVHPERLWGVAIGAPGAVTRIDDRFDYWLGTRNLADVFGAPIDLPALRRIEIQLFCGDQDLAEIRIPPAIAEQLKGLGDLGRNRVERMSLLLTNYREHGLEAASTSSPGSPTRGSVASTRPRAFWPTSSPETTTRSVGSSARGAPIYLAAQTGRSPG